MMGIEWTLIGTGIALAMLMITLFTWLRTDMKSHVERLEAGQGELRNHIERLEVGQGELRERMAKLEDLLEGLREAITGPRAA